MAWHHLKTRLRVQPAALKTAFTNLGTGVTKGMATCIGAIDKMLQNNGLPTIAESANKAKEKIIFCV